MSSADYRLSDDGRGVVHLPSGRRWPLRGRELDLYRVLDLARGRHLEVADLLYCIYGTDRYAHKNNVRMWVRDLRRRVSRDIVDTHYAFGYSVKKEA